MQKYIHLIIGCSYEAQLDKYYRKYSDYISRYWFRSYDTMNVKQKHMMGLN